MRRIPTIHFVLAVAALTFAASAIEAAETDPRVPVKDVKESKETKESKEAEPRAPAKKVCLPQAETREQIKTLRLHEPFAALKAASQHYKAEALSAKLCRIDDDLVYEIRMLHRDGRFFNAHVDAVTGKLVELNKRTVAAAPKN